MERRLYSAAVKGDVKALHEILQEDPLVLDRVTLTFFNETPLHIAVMREHVDFAKEILQQNPQLAMELDSRNSSPLHMASVKGNLEIVKALLEVNLDMCLARDVDGRNPLHLAAMKGRVEVLELLVQQTPYAALERLYSGETILHLCVQQNQLEVLKMLVQALNDPQFVNAKDDNGNTVLHIAVSDRKMKTINYLLLNTGVEVNAVNLYGLTAMDILIQSRRDVKDMDIRDSLSRAGAVAAKDSPKHSTQGVRTIEQENRIENFSGQQKDDWLERKRNVLMIVASLIATMAFQAGMNPPGGFWQETKKVDSPKQGGPVSQQAGHSIWADNDPFGYEQFLLFNTVGFIASLSIILLLISGLPLKRKVFVWILMVIMWIAISAVAITYALSIVMVTTWNEEDNIVLYVVASVVYVWMALVGLLIVVHLIRFIIKIIKAPRKSVRRKRLELNSRVVSV